MQKPPGAVEVKLRKNFLNLIVLQTLDPINSSDQEPNESLEGFPALPEHLDKLIDQPWTKDASRQLDWWLWYVQQEFETAGGTV